MRNVRLGNAADDAHRAAAAKVSNITACNRLLGNQSEIVKTP